MTIELPEVVPWPLDAKFRRFAAKVADACTIAFALGAQLEKGGLPGANRVCPLGALLELSLCVDAQSFAKTAHARVVARASDVKLYRYSFADCCPISDVSAEACARLLGGTMSDWVDECGAFERGYDGELREGFPPAYFQLGAAYRARARA